MIKKVTATIGCGVFSSEVAQSEEKVTVFGRIRVRVRVRVKF